MKLMETFKGKKLVRQKNIAKRVYPVPADTPKSDIDRWRALGYTIIIEEVKRENY